MWMAEVPRSHPFVLLVMGVQYRSSSPSPSSFLLIAQINELLTKSAVHVEDLEQEGRPSQGRSRVWLSYWPSPAAYEQWWSSIPVASLWNSLAEDAGVWREKLSLDMSRVQFGTSQERPSGFAHLGKLVPNLTKSGYWGCYRDRIAEATETERLNSPLDEWLSLKTRTGEIKTGRVLLTKFPENLCIVVEGQDHSDTQDAERLHWLEHFDKPARKWITDVSTAGASGGVLSARLCCAPSSGLISERFEAGKFSTLNYNRKVQLLYFSDMAAMERIAITNKGHVAMREHFMKSYCPVGPMKAGKQLMWVEMGILRASDVEAEYVGCYDDTGFLAMREHPAFGGQA